LIALLALVFVFIVISFATVAQGQFFIGISYALVYIGAIAVVFVLVVLLVDHYHTNFTNKQSRIGKYVLLGLIA